MNFLWIFFLGELKDRLFKRAFKCAWRWKVDREELRRWDTHREIPVAGWLLQKQLKRRATTTEQKAIQAIVKVNRYLANSRTIETILALLFQQLEQWRRKPKPTLEKGVKFRTNVRISI